MADKSGIEWTDATWNPVTGCSKVSPGCANCYAETLTARYAGTNPGWIDEHRPWTPANAEHNVRLRPERLEMPLRWTRPRMIFVNSMSDLFHPILTGLPDETVQARQYAHREGDPPRPSYIAEAFAVMSMAEQHVFQVLTKRPKAMALLLGHANFWLEVNAIRMRRGVPVLKGGMSDFAAGRLTLPNVWLGTSVESNRYVERADWLRHAPAAVRFISAEPLLGPLDKLSLEDIDWLIAGGESAGPPGRSLVRHEDNATVHLGSEGRFVKGRKYEPKPAALEWIRDLRDRCDEHNVAFLFKQWGGATPKSGGRELDGRTWDEYPGGGGAGS